MKCGLAWLSSSSFERFIDLSFLRFEDTEYPTTVGSSSMYSSYVDTGAINGAFNDPAKMIGLHYVPFKDFLKKIPSIGFVSIRDRLRLEHAVVIAAAEV